MLGKHGSAHATPLAWNVCFSRPQCLLGNLNFFKAKQAWDCQLDSQPPFPSSSWRERSSDSDMQQPCSHKTHEPQEKLALPGPLEVALNDHDCFRNPGYANQGVTGHANGQFRLRQQRGFSGRLQRRQLLVLKRWRLDLSFSLALDVMALRNYYCHCASKAMTRNPWELNHWIQLCLKATLPLNFQLNKLMHSFLYCSSQFE